MGIEFLLLVVVFVGGILLSRWMAIQRGKSPITWGVCSALFSPFITVPVLFFFPLTEEAKSRRSPKVEEKESSSSSYKKPLLSVIGVLALAYFIVLAIEAGLSAEFEALLSRNDMGEFKVVETRMSPLVLFGGRNDVDVFVQGANGKTVRLAAIVSGSPIFGPYIEIPALELLKIQF